MGTCLLNKKYQLYHQDIWHTWHLIIPKNLTSVENGKRKSKEKTKQIKERKGARVSSSVSSYSGWIALLICLIGLFHCWITILLLSTTLRRKLLVRFLPSYSSSCENTSYLVNQNRQFILVSPKWCSTAMRLWGGAGRPEIANSVSAVSMATSPLITSLRFQHHCFWLRIWPQDLCLVWHDI